MLSKEDLKFNVLSLARGGLLSPAEREETGRFLEDLVRLYEAAERYFGGASNATETMQDILARNQDVPGGEQFNISQIRDASDDDERFFQGRWVVCVKGNGFFLQGRRYQIWRERKGAYGVFHTATKMVYTGEANDDALFMMVSE